MPSAVVPKGEKVEGSLRCAMCDRDGPFVRLIVDSATSARWISSNLRHAPIRTGPSGKTSEALLSWRLFRRALLRGSALNGICELSRLSFANSNRSTRHGVAGYFGVFRLALARLKAPFAWASISLTPRGRGPTSPKSLTAARRRDRPSACSSDADLWLGLRNALTGFLQRPRNRQMCHRDVRAAVLCSLFQQA